MALPTRVTRSQGGVVRIGVPELSSEDGQFKWSVPVQGLDGAPAYLWFTLPTQHAEIVTERADPAVIGLLLPAMYAAQPIEVAGPVTEELAYNLSHGYQYVLKAMIAGLTPVALDVLNPVRAGDPAPGVGTGFSAGVDSYAVLADHHFAPVPEDLRLTHLAFFNVGSHDRGEPGRIRFRDRFRALAPVADEIGLPLVPIDSNLDDFYNFSTFPRTQGPRTMSAASLLQRGIGRYYFASAVPYAQLGVRRIKESSNADPIALPLFITRQFRPAFHGLEYTRVDKTYLVAEIPVSHSSLNVCVFPVSRGRNCSKCLKCLRTQLTLEIAGRLDEYQQVFDLTMYRQLRPKYLDEVVTTRKDAYMAEIRDQARQASFRLPPYALALARRGVRAIVRKARSLFRRVRRSLTTA